MIDSHYLPIFKENFKMKYLRFYFTARLHVKLHGKIYVWFDLCHLHWVYSFQRIYNNENANHSIDNTKINFLVNKKTIAGKGNLKVTYTQD